MRTVTLRKLAYRFRRRKFGYIRCRCPRGIGLVLRVLLPDPTDNRTRVQTDLAAESVRYAWLRRSTSDSSIEPFSCSGRQKARVMSHVFGGDGGGTVKDICHIVEMPPRATRMEVQATFPFMPTMLHNDRKIAFGTATKNDHWDLAAGAWIKNSNESRSCRGFPCRKKIIGRKNPCSRCAGQIFLIYRSLPERRLSKNTIVRSCQVRS